MAQGVSHHASTRAWRGVRGFVSQNILAARKYSGLRFNESFNWIQRTERRGWRWRETRRIPEAETAARRWLGAGAISTQFLCFISGCSSDSLISWAREILLHFNHYNIKPVTCIFLSMDVFWKSQQHFYLNIPSCVLLNDSCFRTKIYRYQHWHIIIHYKEM